MKFKERINLNLIKIFIMNSEQHFGIESELNSIRDGSNLKFDVHKDNCYRLKVRNLKWGSDEDDLLVKLVEEFGGKFWKKISSNFINRSPIQCLHRWTKILKPGLIKGPWTADEDRMLTSYVNFYGSASFIECSKLIPGRTNKQCRERWFNVLDPRMFKGDWNLEEDYLIFRLYSLFGGKWVKFMPYFSGVRAENTIKNRFYSTIRKYETQLRRKKLSMILASEDLKVSALYSKLKKEIMQKYELKSKSELENFEKCNLGFHGTLASLCPSVASEQLTSFTNKSSCSMSTDSHEGSLRKPKIFHLEKILKTHQTDKKKSAQESNKPLLRFHVEKNATPDIARYDELKSGLIQLCENSARVFKDSTEGTLEEKFRFISETYMLDQLSFDKNLTMFNTEYFHSLNNTDSCSELKTNLDTMLSHLGCLGDILNSTKAQIGSLSYSECFEDIAKLNFINSLNKRSEEPIIVSNYESLEQNLESTIRPVNSYIFD